MKILEYTKRTLPKTDTEITYSVIVDELKNDDGITAAESYGIAISISPENEKLIRGITTDCGEIIRMIEKFAECSVTPITLYDVVIDWLG